METKPNLGDEAINGRASPGDRKGCLPVAVTQQSETHRDSWMGHPRNLVVESWLAPAGYLPVSGHEEAASPQSSPCCSEHWHTANTNWVFPKSAEECIWKSLREKGELLMLNSRSIFRQ